MTPIQDLLVAPRTRPRFFSKNWYPKDSNPLTFLGWSGSTLTFLGKHEETEPSHYISLSKKNNWKKSRKSLSRLSSAPRILRSERRTQPWYSSRAEYQIRYVSFQPEHYTMFSQSEKHGRSQSVPAQKCTCSKGPGDSSEHWQVSELTSTTITHSKSLHTGRQKILEQQEG